MNESSDEVVGLKAGIACNGSEAEEDDCGEDICNPFESLEPYFVVPADCLECAPEAVCEVEPECPEPDYVDDNIVPLSECQGKEFVWIFRFGSCPFLELHVCPEVSEVECKYSENDDSEHNHVAGCP